jgi:hypothetical protein
MLRKRVIVHAGYHKTGTTSIQTALTNSRERLRAAGVLYPHSGVPPRFPYGQHLLPWSLMKRPPAGFSFTAAARAALWRELCAEIDSRPEPLVILSSEEFDRLDALEIAVLAQNLRCHDIVPVIFLRDHADLIESMFRTYVIHLEYSGPVEQFAAEEAPRLDCAAMTGDWIAVARGGAAVVMSYEDAAIRENAIAAFFDAAGLDLGLCREEQALRANASMPAFVCEVVRDLRARGVDEPRIQVWVAEVLAAGLPPRLNTEFVSMPRGLATRLHQRFAAEAAAIAADPALNARLRGSLVPAAPAPEPQVVRDATHARELLRQAIRDGRAITEPLPARHGRGVADHPD